MHIQIYRYIDIYIDIYITHMADRGVVPRELSERLIIYIYTHIDIDIYIYMYTTHIADGGVVSRQLSKRLAGARVRINREP